MVLKASLENSYIHDLITTQTYSCVYLKNSIRLKGHLIYHDDSCVLLRDKHEGQIQIIYKDKISTIMPKVAFTNF